MQKSNETIDALSSTEMVRRTGIEHVYTLNDDEVLVAHPDHPPVIYNFVTGIGRPITDPALGK